MAVPLLSMARERTVKPGRAPSTRRTVTIPIRGPMLGRDGGTASGSSSNFANIPLEQQRAAPGLVQAKLSVGRVDDPLEHEADRVAEHVMRMPDPEHDSDTRATNSATTGPQQVSRKCAGCEEEEQQKVRRKSTGGSSTWTAAAPDSVYKTIASPGQALDPKTRAFMEPRFGHDFSNVRVHADASAAASAQAVGARAYTVGSNLVFGSGQWSPGSDAGRRLIAHELAHVVQQNGSSGDLSAARMAVRRDPLDAGAIPASAPASKVKDLAEMHPSGEMDVSEGRAFAEMAIAAMAPFGATVSAPPSDAVASAEPGPSAPVGEVQTSPLAGVAQRSGGGSVKPEAGFVGAIQLCYDMCNGEFSARGWIWAGGGVETRGLFGGKAWWGAYVFAEKEFFKTTLDWMPKLQCGTCAPGCKPEDGASDWGGGISGFPVILEPGKKQWLKKFGIEAGLLLTPHLMLCDADLELIALIDVTKYLGAVGPAVVAAKELANKLGEKLGITIDCGVGLAFSGTAHLCKSVPGGGLYGITSDSALLCGGGYVGCAVGLGHDKSSLPGI